MIKHTSVSFSISVTAFCSNANIASGFDLLVNSPENRVYNIHTYFLHIKCDKCLDMVH